MFEEMPLNPSFKLSQIMQLVAKPIVERDFLEPIAKEKHLTFTQLRSFPEVNIKVTPQDVRNLSDTILKTLEKDMPDLQDAVSSRKYLPNHEPAMASASMIAQATFAVQHILGPYKVEYVR